MQIISSTDGHHFGFFNFYFKIVQTFQNIFGELYIQIGITSYHLGMFGAIIKTAVKCPKKGPMVIRKIVNVSSFSIFQSVRLRSTDLSHLKFSNWISDFNNFFQKIIILCCPSSDRSLITLPPNSSELHIFTWPAACTHSCKYRLFYTNCIECLFNEKYGLTSLQIQLRNSLSTCNEMVRVLTNTTPLSVVCFVHKFLSSLQIICTKTGQMSMSIF